MYFEDAKSKIKQYINESQTRNELFGKIMDLYMNDDSIPIETREKTRNLIEKYYYFKEWESNLNNSERIFWNNKKRKWEK